MHAGDVASLIAQTASARLPLFLWGAPGIGKSSVVRQVAQQLQIDFLDIRLALLDPTDLKGIPYFDQATSRGTWAPPSFLPYDPKSRGILFLDEINTAPPAVQASAYQLILDRRVGEYCLPDGWTIVAAGNRESDRGIVYKMPPPLANRFVHIEMEVSLEAWKKWAYRADIDTSIIAYISHDPSILFRFDPAQSTRGFPTPRSWSYVNTLIGLELPPQKRLEILTGAVGEEAAAGYIAFCDVMDHLPDLDAIVTGELQEVSLKDPKVLSALCTGLVSRLSRNNTPEAVERVMAFSLTLPGEFSVVLVRDMQHAGIDIEATPSWSVWVKQFAHLIV